jgi:formylglycine-generating enzyme required for sulfatase activity
LCYRFQSVGGAIWEISVETHAARLTDDDRTFIGASTAHHEAERKRAEEQEQRLREEQLENERLAREKAEREAQVKAAAARRTVRRTRVAVVLGVLAVLLTPVAVLVGESVSWARNYGVSLEFDLEKARRAYGLGMASQVSTMVPVPEGSFMMGSEKGDPDERKPHEVTFAQPFHIAATEVTFAQYDAFAAATGRSPPGDSGWGRGERPVINVSWEDAQAYVAWFSAKTGQSCRLPSEAEWEYACRAGTTTRFALPAPDGSDDIAGKGLANCGECGSEWDGNQTAPVRSFDPNRWGLHDMHGNVAEWVEDCWHDSYEGAPQDGQAWLEGNGGTCGRLVLRGGSWSGGHNQDDARCANRTWVVPSLRGNIIGFRVVCSSPTS